MVISQKISWYSAVFLRVPFLGHIFLRYRSTRSLFGLVSLSDNLQVLSYADDFTVLSPGSVVSVVVFLRAFFNSSISYRLSAFGFSPSEPDLLCIRASQKIGFRALFELPPLEHISHLFKEHGILRADKPYTYLAFLGFL